MTVSRGFTDTLAAYHMAPSDSGYGTISANPTLLASSLSCRFTKFSARQETRREGRDSEKVWDVTVEPTSVFDDFQTREKELRVVRNGSNYKVEQVRIQKDHHGTVDHIYLKVSLDG